MICLGLIGYPLGHSLSPQIHTAALKSCGLEGDYSLFPISPDDHQSLKDLLLRVRSREIQGLNVTIPHKRNVMQFLDEMTPTATAIGAVNTMYLHGNKLIGDNTDAPGFLSDLNRLQATETQGHRELSALILGAGGSARAVVYALLNAGWEVTIAARRIEQAQELADAFANFQLSITTCSLSTLQPPISRPSLIVNATPIGMAPNIDKTPWPENIQFPHHAMIYDLVYNPRQTKLVRNASIQGLAATSGLGMLIEQAALSFEIWTGQNPSREIMRDSIDHALISNHHSSITNQGTL